MENHLTIGGGGGGNHNANQHSHRMQHSYNPDEMQNMLSDLKMKPRDSEHSAAGSVRAYLLKRQSTAGTFHSTVSRKSRRHLFQALHHAHLELHDDVHHDDDFHTEHSHSHHSDLVVSDRGFDSDADGITTDDAESPPVTPQPTQPSPPNAPKMTLVTTAASVPIEVQSVSSSNNNNKSRPQRPKTTRSSGPRSSVKGIKKVRILPMSVATDRPMLFNETLVEEAMSKEAEIELREQIKREMKMHYENEKEQIKVDAHAEIAAAKMEYEEETAKLKDEVAKLQDDKFERTLFETEILDYRRRLSELEEQLSEMRAANASPYLDGDVPDKYYDEDEDEEPSSAGRRGSRTQLQRKMQAHKDENDYNVCSMLFKNLK